jgi:hypothetical protein
MEMLIVLEKRTLEVLSVMVGISFKGRQFYNTWAPCHAVPTAVGISIHHEFNERFVSIFCQQKIDEKTAGGIVDVVLTKIITTGIALNHWSLI